MLKRNVSKLYLEKTLTLKDVRVDDNVKENINVANVQWFETQGLDIRFEDSDIVGARSITPS